jgi:hypothetical protein
MDQYVDGFREVARMRSSAHPTGPKVRLVLAVLGGVALAVFGILVLLSGDWFGIVLGVFMIAAGPVSIVSGIQQHRLAVHALGLAADGVGLSMVEGPVRWVRTDGSADDLEVGDQRFDLSNSAGLGRQLRKLRREPGPTTARAWYLPGSGLADPVLVRLDARSRSEAELMGDLTDLQHRFHTAADAIDVRWDRYEDFIAELPAMKAGFADDASATARAAAARRLVHFQEQLGSRGQEHDQLPDVIGPRRSSPSAQPPRPPLPAAVRWSFRLWKAVGVLGLIPLGVVLFVTLYGVPVSAPADQSILVGIAVLAVVTAFSCAILYFARRTLAGRRRARTVLAVVGGIWGVLLFMIALANARSDESVPWAVLALAQVEAIVAAIVLMYLPEASRYFR